MPLPATYYDFIQGIRPYLIEHADNDARLLSQKGVNTISSVDDFESSFEYCLEDLKEQFISDLSSRHGHPLNAVPFEYRQAFMSLVQTVNFEYHCMVNFSLSGKKTFHFSDNLSDHLANTEVNQKAGLIELPFPTCQFLFSSKSVIDAVHNIRGEKGRVDMNSNRIDYTAPVSVFITKKKASEPYLDGDKLIVVVIHAKPPNKSYALLKREIYLAPEWSLEQALRTDWGKITPDAGKHGLSIDNADGSEVFLSDDVFYRDGLLLYRIILNSILYLSSGDADLIQKDNYRGVLEKEAEALKAPAKKRKKLQSLSRYSELDYHDVGSSVGSIVIDRSAEHGKDKSTGSKALTVRFMVRGHWRNQVHGEGRKERKLIWIKPFYKGSDLASEINKPYLVK